MDAAPKLPRSRDEVQVALAANPDNKEVLKFARRKGHKSFICREAPRLGSRLWFKVETPNAHHWWVATGPALKLLTIPGITGPVVSEIL